MKTKTPSIRATVQDLNKFKAMARRGEIPEEAVAAYSLLFAASRNVQIVMGPGHAPMDAIFISVPEQYGRNWLKTAMKLAA
jgi:hypothetical protein